MSVSSLNDCRKGEVESSMTQLGEKIEMVTASDSKEVNCTSSTSNLASSFKASEDFRRLQRDHPPRAMRR